MDENNEELRDELQKSIDDLHRRSRHTGGDFAYVILSLSTILGSSGLLSYHLGQYRMVPKQLSVVNIGASILGLGLGIVSTFRDENRKRELRYNYRNRISNLAMLRSDLQAGGYDNKELKSYKEYIANVLLAVEERDEFNQR